MGELRQQTVDLSMLLARAAEESYEALKELVENSRGSEMPDSEKKIGILKYIIKTQQRVLQLNVLSKCCQQVDGLMRLMEGEHVGPFNLGNPSEFTMLELAQVVQETIDPNAKIEFKPKTEDDPHKRNPDITKAKELLGWEPKIPLRKGLPMMVSDFRQRVFGDHKDDGGCPRTIDPNAKIEFKPKTEDDPHKRKPGIRKAKELLGWEPKIPLRKGLPMMVSDFRQRVFRDHKDDGGASTTSA